ncbi:MAG: hypothetical protein JWL92_379 [Candidatus Nomurabacteria bacterium]|nr:hypothetical protein [Candidatus Nomurabacteria bacterium]
MNNEKVEDKLHPSHKTRFSDASSFDEICIHCGAHDILLGGWGQLALPCPKAPSKEVKKVEEPTASKV